MDSKQELTLRPIGMIRTPFNDRYAAPRQPEEDAGREGVIELNAGANFEQALQDLEGFDYVWLLFWFDRNAGWKPKVLPPRGPRKRRGVFATRSPHRPNPIGLSLVKLIEINGRKLRVGGVDLLDGTPILDIKPYVPYADSRPAARAGWLDAAEEAAHYRVTWSPLAREQAEWLAQEFEIDLRAHTERVLSQDPTPHRYRRIAAQGEKFLLALKSWRMRFTLNLHDVVIERVFSGYPPTELKRRSNKDLHQGEAHRTFHQRWPGADEAR